MNSAILVHVSGKFMCSFLLQIHLGIELAGHRASLGICYLYNGRFNNVLELVLTSEQEPTIKFSVTLRAGC